MTTLVEQPLTDSAATWGDRPGGTDRVPLQLRLAGTGPLWRRLALLRGRQLLRAQRA